VSLFNNCVALTSITLGNNYIGPTQNFGFSGCTGLISVTFPTNASFTTIGSNNLGGATSLQNINIPSNVTLIKDGSFSGCTGLISLTIPSTLTTIQNNCFTNCTNLKNVYFLSTTSTPATTAGTRFFSNIGHPNTAYIQDLTTNTTSITGLFDSYYYINCFTPFYISNADFSSYKNI
jgi:hypothetical protein